MGSLSLPLAAEWRSLLRETDAELRAEGFLHLAGRLERRGGPAETEAAISLYRDLTGSPAADGARRAAQRPAVWALGFSPVGSAWRRKLRSSPAPLAPAKRCSAVRSIGARAFWAGSWL